MIPLTDWNTLRIWYLYYLDSFMPPVNLINDFECKTEYKHFSAVKIINSVRN